LSEIKRLIKVTRRRLLPRYGGGMGCGLPTAFNMDDDAARHRRRCLHGVPPELKASIDGVLNVALQC